METLDDVREHQRRRVDGVVQWALLGFLLGGLGPFVPLVWIGVSLPLAAFVAASTLVGLVGGVIAGVIDLPRHGLHGGRFETGVSGCLYGFLGLLLGMFWGAAAGVAGGLAMGFAVSLDPPPFGPFLEPGPLARLGGSMGAVAGAPAVAMFSAARAVLQRLGWPTWLALPLAAALVLVLGLGGFWLVMNSTDPKALL